MWLVSLTSLAAIAISSSSACPTAEAVQSRLAALLPAAKSADSVRIVPSEDGLELELRSALQNTVSRRRLPWRPSCDEQAAIAATVIAAWQLEGQGAPEPPPPATTGMPPPVTMSPMPPMPMPPPLLPLPAVRPSYHYEIAAAGSLVLSSSGLAAGGALDAVLTGGARQLAARLGLFGATPRTLPLGPGQAEWLRAGLRLSGGYRFLPLGEQPWSIDWFADALLALVWVSGSGFDITRDSRDFDFGVGTSVRVGRLLGRVRVFVEFTLAGWLRTQWVSAQTAEQPLTRLPQLDGLFSLGLASGGAVRKK